MQAARLGLKLFTQRREDARGAGNFFTRSREEKRKTGFFTRIREEIMVESSKLFGS
ncbi:hypothetical protein SBDP1_1030008 [Syntrophobacter sp. SbD1]|nr:hypothetical protein SBDP1_1030008 [Syntrophobacter sp. SbD1]